LLAPWLSRAEYLDCWSDQYFEFVGLLRRCHDRHLVYEASSVFVHRRYFVANLHGRRELPLRGRGDARHDLG
jgi:hypothetical protein